MGKRQACLQEGGPTTIAPFSVRRAVGHVIVSSHVLTMAPAQSFVTSYPPRVRQYANTLLQPVLQTQNVGPGSRTTKRGTTIINYADDAYDDDDFDDSETSRRPTGLRSLRREDLEKREPQHEKLGKEIYQPVALQPIYRDWIVRRTVRPTYVEEMPLPRPSPIRRKKDNVVDPYPMN